MQHQQGFPHHPRPLAELGGLMPLQRESDLLCDSFASPEKGMWWGSEMVHETHTNTRVAVEQTGPCKPQLQEACDVMYAACGGSGGGTLRAGLPNAQRWSKAPSDDSHRIVIHHRRVRWAEPIRFEVNPIRVASPVPPAPNGDGPQGPRRSTTQCVFQGPAGQGGRWPQDCPACGPEREADWGIVCRPPANAVTGGWSSGCRPSGYKTVGGQSGGS
jgi:hypothetical protein|mmetsp:Transcript_41214/g.69283  ORF Transcript_41214/g.69283 Transcript_41214/m.69283 type:complete len:216 (-) Transcript_41214:197-844(-)